MNTILIGVCTFRRPKMLRTCLDSLAGQLVPPDCTLQVVVVDNEAQPNNQAVVEEFAASCPFPVHYVHQPRRGISAARNAILDKALELNPDWVAMVDDDEIADPTWIANLMAPEYRHVAVLGGRRLWIFPEPKPFWAPENQLRGFTEGGAIAEMGTGNVRFSIALVKAGLRFDEKLALSAGEDFKFFSDARSAGFEVRRTNRAIMRETFHRERAKYSFILKKQYAHVAGLTHDRRMEVGVARLALELPTLAFTTVVGVLELMISPLAYAFGRRRFKQIAIRGGKRLASTAGVIGALAGARPQLYSQVAGH